jgi:hypothetical protein
MKEIVPESTLFSPCGNEFYFFGVSKGRKSLVYAARAEVKRRKVARTGHISINQPIRALIRLEK